MKTQGIRYLKITPNSILVLLLGIGFLASCETSPNPRAQSFIDKQNIIYEAEKRTESIVWEIDLEQNSIEMANYGLDPLFIPESLFNNTESNPINPLKTECRNTQFSNSEFENISGYLDAFENRQIEIIDLANSLKQNCIDSLIAYKTSLNQRLNAGNLTQIQYDLLLTKAEETFIQDLRHRYNESKILTTSASNLKVVLNEIEEVLSEKSWGRFMARLKEK